MVALTELVQTQISSRIDIVKEEKIMDSTEQHWLICSQPEINLFWESAFNTLEL